MVTRLAIIHTTPVTIEPLKGLANDILPGYQIMNFLDDTILPELLRNGGDIGAVADRWLTYARFAEQAGADCVLSACSSVGELADLANQKQSVPVLRIDEAMAQAAIRRGKRIGVAATLPTTLNPTTKLLQREADMSGIEIQLETLLAEEAYQRLMDGDKAGHDQILGDELLKLVARTDVVVLAQASMAAVVTTLPTDVQQKFLTSPRLGLERIKEIFEVTV